MSDETKQDSEPEANPNEEQTPLTEESVDLVAEAREAALAEQPQQSQKLRSLDDLDLDGNVRRQIESYVSKSINEAVSAHDHKQQQKLDNEGFMNRSQIEELMAQKDADFQRRDQAKEQLMSTLGEEGIAPGSKEYTAVQQYYAKAVNEGKVTHHILLSDAGIRTLVAMSGVTSDETSAGPGGGLARSNPDGIRLTAGGEVQLNKDSARADTLDAKMREAMEKATRG